VIEGQFAVAFATGMMAVANPCGFAMLPAYLSFFLGLEGQDDDARATVSRALAVAFAVSVGFAATFALIDQVIRHATREVYEWSPWLSVLIGFALMGMGAYLLSGRELRVRLPRLDRGGRSGSFLQMALYGVSYAVVSLGCTLPAFSAYISTTTRNESVLSGVAIFLAYAAGFTVLLTSLTIGIALARHGVLHSVRRSLPYLQRISGGLLVAAGAYVAYYGWYELHRLGDEDPIIDRVNGWSAEVSAWINDAGAVRLGLLLSLVIAGAAVAVATRRRRAT
jgi:cytochrome c biogenesis protein CcdA